MLARISQTKEPPKWSAKSGSVARLQASHFDSEKESSVHGQSKYDFRFGDVAIDVSDSQRKSSPPES